MTTFATPAGNAGRVPRRRGDLAHGLLWISPWLFGTCVFLLLPIGASVYYSLTEFSLLEPPVFVGLSNYRELLHDDQFWRVARNTLYFACGSVLGSTVLSIALALLLEQRLRGAALARAIVFLPTLVPATASGVTWLWLFNGKYGLINSALASLGIHGPDWLGDTRLAMPSLLFMSLWVVGSAVMVVSAALKDVPTSLYEAADLDGVKNWGKFRHVTLPMISPAVMFNTVMSIIWAVQVFAAPYIMTKGGPQQTTMVYAMYIYNNAFVYGRMGYACALAWVQVLVTLVLAIVVIRLARRWVYYRGT